MRVTPESGSWFEPQAPPRPGQTSVAPEQPNPAPTPTPLGTVGITPGYTPDYTSLIASDPGYLSYLNNAQLNIDQAAAQRRAALQALVVRYGGIGGITDKYGDIDQTTRDLASKNQYSDVARLQRNYEQGVESFKRSLAARGGIQSGELKYGLDQAALARSTSDYDLAQEFSNAVQQAINGYLGVESSARQGLSEAVRGAEQSVYSNPLNRPREGSSATLDPDWQSKYGKPVYTGPDGTQYELGPDGNPKPYVSPVQPGPAPSSPGYIDPFTSWQLGHGAVL
jgi:hypothetical protein